jgi:hypothetical protein
MNNAVGLRFRHPGLHSKPPHAGEGRRSRRGGSATITGDDAVELPEQVGTTVPVPGDGSAGMNLPDGGRSGIGLVPRPSRRSGVATMGLDRSLARLAIAAGVVAIASDASYLVFTVAGEPFGSLNDIGNAAFGILAGWLAWTVRDRTGSTVAVVALAGAAISVVGSSLVLAGTTGWFLGGLVSAVGFALIGPSVVVYARSALAGDGLPRRLGQLGVATGSLMVVGLVSIAGVAMRFDNADTAPGWTWIGFVGWIGAFVLYPAWAIWLGRLASRVRSRPTG